MLVKVPCTPLRQHPAVRKHSSSVLEAASIAEIEDNIALTHIALSHFDQKIVIEEPMGEIARRKYPAESAPGYRRVI